MTKLNKRILTRQLRPLVESMVVDILEGLAGPAKKRKAKRRAAVEEDEDDDDVEEDEDDDVEEDEDDDDVEEDEDVEEEDDEDDDEDDEDMDEGDLIVKHKGDEECEGEGKGKKRRPAAKRKPVKESVGDNSLRREVILLRREKAVRGIAAKLGVKASDELIESLCEMPAKKARVVLTEMQAGRRSKVKSGVKAEDDWADALTEGLDESAAPEKVKRADALAILGGSN